VTINTEQEQKLQNPRLMSPVVFSKLKYSIFYHMLSTPLPFIQYLII